MKIIWLGQGGFLFETDGTKIIIDPYLSNSCEKVNPTLKRRFPANKEFLNIKPDVIILTHSHLDHTDPETLDYYLKNTENITVLAAKNAFEKIRSLYKKHNLILFQNGTQFTEKGITFKAVYAEHSDETAIGTVFSVSGKTYYITGDTLYNQRVFDSIKDKIDYVFLPINGKGNNMNAADAARFAEKIGAKVAVACHFGLFDDITPQSVKNRSHFIFPTPFEEIAL